MIRQARNYLVGAMSGAGLIAAAIAVFAVLVSTQVFGDFPIPGLLGGGDTGVSGAKEVAAPAAGSAGAADGAVGAKATAGAGKAGGANKGGSAGGAADVGNGAGGGPPNGGG